MTTSTQVPIDLWHSSSYTQGHPVEQYHWLLENAPVYWHEAPEAGRGFWVVTSHALVKEVSTQNTLYSSYAGGITLWDVPEEQLPGLRQMMLNMDPPQHSRYRKLVSPQFLPKQAQAWRDSIERLASDIIDEVCERGECDLVAEIAGRLPSYVVAKLLGIPLEVGVHLYDLTEVMHSALDSVTDEQRMAVAMQAYDFSSRLYDDKLANPGDDLASRLAHAEIDGHRLAKEEFQAFIGLLVNAGGDTTRGLVGGAMVSLIRRPEILARFRANADELMPTAIEELLRFQAPVTHMRRTATADTVLGGVDIKAGDKVAVFYGAANRDPAVFERPDDIILDRHPNPHIAFGGGGAHFCLGAHFARIEIAAMLRQILLRLHDLQLAEEPAWVPSNFTSGPQHARITFTPSPKAAVRA